MPARSATEGALPAPAPASANPYDPFGVSVDEEDTDNVVRGFENAPIGWTPSMSTYGGAWFAWLYNGPYGENVYKCEPWRALKTKTTEENDASKLSRLDCKRVSSSSSLSANQREQDREELKSATRMKVDLEIIAKSHIVDIDNVDKECMSVRVASETRVQMLPFVDAVLKQEYIEQNIADIARLNELRQLREEKIRDFDSKRAKILKQSENFQNDKSGSSSTPRSAVQTPISIGPTLNEEND